ncbi:hypothetical protein CBS147354_5167 [Penicillium roqueforti]|nr:hypothetical protein CBS147354_5167 [Penicillium roqueforti]
MFAVRLLAHRLYKQVLSHFALVSCFSCYLSQGEEAAGPQATESKAKGSPLSHEEVGNLRAAAQNAMKAADATEHHAAAAVAPGSGFCYMPNSQMNKCIFPSPLPGGPTKASVQSVPMTSKTSMLEHSIFQDRVTRCNGREIERTLLLEESSRRTLGIYLEGAFAAEDAPTTAMIQQAAKKCPSVFADLYNNPLVDRMEKENIRPSNMRKFAEAALHHDIRMWVSRTSNSVTEIELRTRLCDLPISYPFLQKLRHAYAEEYQIENLSSPGSYPIHWYDKASFYQK